jgi:hypothetical protein
MVETVLLLIPVENTIKSIEQSIRQHALNPAAEILLNERFLGLLL